MSFSKVKLRPEKYQYEFILYVQQLMLLKYAAWIHWESIIMCIQYSDIR